MTAMRWYRNWGFLMWAVLFVFALIISIATYNPGSVSSPLLLFFVRNHIIVMLVSIFVALIFGFVWSQVLASELKKQRKESKEYLNAALQFMEPAERQVVEFLIKKNGLATQADVSRLQGMSRVKAHRVVQDLQSRNLIEIVPHGKVRELRLKQNIIELLTEN